MLHRLVRFLLLWVGLLLGLEHDLIVVDHACLQRGRFGVGAGHLERLDVVGGGCWPVVVPRK